MGLQDADGGSPGINAYGTTLGFICPTPVTGLGPGNLEFQPVWRRVGRPRSSIYGRSSGRRDNGHFVDSQAMIKPKWFHRLTSASAGKGIVCRQDKEGHPSNPLYRSIEARTGYVRGLAQSETENNCLTGLVNKLGISYPNLARRNTA